MTNENLSPWFDPKYRITRSSREIPVNKEQVEERTEIPELNPNILDVKQNSENNYDLNEKIDFSSSLNRDSSPECVYSESHFDKDQIVSEEQLDNAKLALNLNNTLDNIKIQELLEKIIFNPEELSSLKNAITDLIAGNLKPQQFKSYILNSYIRILEEILSLILFILNQEMNKCKDYSPQFLKELKERDDLLEEFGLKINNIYLNLKKKQPKE